MDIVDATIVSAQVIEIDDFVSTEVCGSDAIDAVDTIVISAPVPVVEVEDFKSIEIYHEASNSGDILPIYDGETTIIPSENEQVLRTNNHSVMDNIVIKPIPSNYGRVSYNGAYLRIE